VTEIWYVCVVYELAPAITNVYVPAGTDALAVIVSVDCEPEVTLVGLNDALRPEGRFEAPKLTV
jgi:hypothetical protein